MVEISYIHYDQIGVPERQRKEFLPKPMDELKKSIKHNGLLQPIVINTNFEGYHVLVAGERRLRTIKELHEENTDIYFAHNRIPSGLVPCVKLENLNTLEQAEIEFDENVVRLDFTWKERAAAMVKIQRLRQELNPDETREETAEWMAERSGQTVKTHQNQLTQALAVEAHKDDEDVQKAPSLAEAARIANKKTEAALILALERKVKERQAEDNEPWYTLTKSDALIELYKLDNKQFDMILCDPPYGMDADKFGDQSVKGHGYKDDADYALAFMEEVFNQGQYILKENSHIFMFCDIRHFEALKRYAVVYGYKPWHTPIIWAKTGMSGHAPWGSKGFRRMYECIFWATRGEARMKGIMNDVLTYPHGDESHGASKPFRLYADLIKNCLIPGSLILDPCCGSGTIFTAASVTSMKAVGIEIDDRYYAEAVVKRDKALSMQAKQVPRVTADLTTEGASLAELEHLVKS